MFLVVTHKAVQHLSVLVYDIATESYYREQMEEVRACVRLLFFNIRRHN